MRWLIRPTSALVLLLAAGLSGCGDGPTAQKVQSEHVNESRAAQEQIESALSPLEGIGEQQARAVRDSCVTGQHNYKVDDPYDVRCTVEVHTAYRLEPGDFRAVADTLTQAFPDCGPDSEAETTLRDYWDKLEGTATHNFEGPYRPDYLPDYRLDCAPAGGASEEGAGTAGTVEVTVTGWASLPADGETQKLREHGMGRPCVGATEDTPCEWDGIPAQQIWGFDAAQDGWLVFVQGSREYASTP